MMKNKSKINSIANDSEVVLQKPLLFAIKGGMSKFEELKNLPPKKKD